MDNQETTKKRMGRPKKYFSQESFDEAKKQKMHEYYIRVKPLKQLKQDLDNPEKCIMNLIKILYAQYWNEVLENRVDQHVKQILNICQTQ